MKNNRMKSVDPMAMPLERIPTFRMEALGYKGRGMNEDTKWELHSVHNDLDGAMKMMDESNSCLRLLHCGPNGREVLAQNFSKIDMG